MTPYSRAETILRDLGIFNPDDIDLEAVAWTLGAAVKYRPLDDCDARIIGVNDRAIISINNRRSPPRQRFSLGHELGHWLHHRNRLLFCQADKIERPTVGMSGSEHLADRFAADLLMPRYMMSEFVSGAQRPSFSLVKDVAKIFKTSLTASAIRTVEMAVTPTVLVWHNRRGKRWFTRSEYVSNSWFPNQEVRGDSSAFSVLYGRLTKSNVTKVGAQYWFRNRDAPRFDVTEESIKVGPEEILTILAFVGKNASEVANA